MIRLLTTSIVLLVAAGLTGCGEITTSNPEAVGQSGTLIVVTDEDTWDGPVGDVIRDELAGGLSTLPQPEAALTVRRMDLSDAFYPQIRRQHSVLFVAPYTSPSTTGEFIRARLDDAGIEALDRGGMGIIYRPNLWANNQVVIYATARDEANLVHQIRANAHDMRRAYDRVNRLRLTHDMFRRGRQFEVEQRLMDRHGFAVNVQHDYVLVRDTTFETVNRTAGTFIRLRRIADADSWRDLFIYYEQDPRLERLHPDSVRVLRNRLSRKFVRGSDDTTYIHIEDRYPDRRPVVTDTVNFAGRWALETRGTWYLGFENGRSAGMGGPFVNFAFYDEESGRFFLIDGMIFAPRPQYSRREFLRQMEAIAYTFRTHETADAVVADRVLDDVPSAP
jgi:hypothetical protein